MSKDAHIQLCERCKGSAGCDLPRKPGKSACKAFDAFEYFVPAILQGQIRYEGWDAVNRAAGLCGDCGARDTCMFRRREGGTWHCEEYC